MGLLRFIISLQPKYSDLNSFLFLRKQLPSTAGFAFRPQLNSPSVQFYAQSGKQFCSFRHWSAYLTPSCISNVLTNSRSGVHIWCNRIFPFSLFFFLFLQLCTFRMTPWLIPDRWWIGTGRAVVGYRAAPRAHTLADFLAPASWRHPFTAVLQAVLTAPLRRLPWRRGLSVSARSPLINGAEHWEIGIWFVTSVFLCSGPRTPASINMS